MKNEITYSALADQLFALYVDSGIDQLIPPDQLRAGLDDLLTEAMPLVGELTKAGRRGIALAEAVYDAEAFPNLVRAHGFVSDVLSLELPEELQAWVKRLAVLAAAQPERIEHFGRMLLALAMACPDQGVRLLGRFVVFEALCQAQRIRLRDGDRPLHPEAIEMPPNAVEQVAEAELHAFEAEPELRAGLAEAERPLDVLAHAVQVTFAAWHDEVLDALALVRRQSSVGHARRVAVDALMRGAPTGQPVLFRFRDGGDEILERRGRLLEVMDSLPPAEAVLLRADCAAIFGEERSAISQLKRRHPLLLGGLSDNVIDQRRKRGRLKWAKLVQQPQQQRLVPWRGQTLIEILKTFKEEYPS